MLHQSHWIYYKQPMKFLVCCRYIKNDILCCSRKYPYPIEPIEPPTPAEISFNSHTFIKKIELLKPPSLLEFPLTSFHGVGMDIFWNYTLFFLVPNDNMTLLFMVRINWQTTTTRNQSSSHVQKSVWTYIFA